MTLDPIARIRRFNRAVTTEVGALDASFLGRGRPLGTARVLCAIGLDGAEVGTLREAMGLDSGLLSRLLRGLEEEGLVVTEPDPDDRRRRIARPTAKGAEEIDAYDHLSNDRAASLLSRQSRNAEVLLAAMDLVATALTRHRIEIIETDPRDPRAVTCLSAYCAELNQRFSGGFDVNLSRDPDASSMRRPVGTFLVALSDALPVGCVGLKGTDGGYAEIKRLWISPSARGLKLATRMMDRAADIARELGIGLLKLDSNSALPEAAALYRATGWTEIPRFNDDPYPDLFFEKRL